MSIKNQIVFYIVISITDRNYNASACVIGDEACECIEIAYSGFFLSAVATSKSMAVGRRFQQGVL